MTDATFRTLPFDGTQWPIRWCDPAGVIHACEGSDIHRGVRLVWTRCKIDVPANASALSFDAPTCPACKEADQ
jgi:hypothetical protein